MARRQALETATPRPDDDKAAADTTSAADGPDVPTETPDYGHTTVVTTAGDLEVFGDDPDGTSVTVSSHPEGIGLQLTNNIGRMNVLLLPEDIDRLCQAFQAAKAKTDPDAVEQSHDWLTEQYRSGGSDG